MSKPHRSPRRPVKDEPHRVNHRIRAKEVRLVDADGQQVGVMHIKDAMNRAERAKLDLVEIAPNASPPVCRLLNYGKFRYEQERKDKQAKRNKPKAPHQLKMRPTIGQHDFDVKVNQAARFLAKGELVRVTVQMKGRMQTHPQLAEQLLERFFAVLGDRAVVEQHARREGAQIHALLAPGVTSTTDDELAD